MVRLFGHKHVYDMCRALSFDACSHCLPAHHLHHVLGARKLSSLDGIFGSTHNVSCSLYGLSPTQGQSRCVSEHPRDVLHRRGRNLSIFFSCRSTFGRLRILPCLHATRLRQFSQSHYDFQLYRRIIPGFRSFPQFQALPKRKV